MAMDFENAYLNISHALYVHTTGATIVRDWTDELGQPVFALSVRGTCRCGVPGNEEKTMFLRVHDVAAIVAALRLVVEEADRTPQVTAMVDQFVTGTRKAHEQFPPTGHVTKMPRDWRGHERNN